MTVALRGGFFVDFSPTKLYFRFIVNRTDSRAFEPTVSAIVVCFNEERHIGDCLESLRWCDEIVVVDSFSTEGTVEICRLNTDRVLQRGW